MTTENPYLKMTPEVLTEHIGQIKAGITEQKLDVTQFFGEPRTDADTANAENVVSLTAKVDELSAAAASKDLTDNEVTLAQAGVDRAVSDIHKIDASAPLEGILQSKFNNLEKLSILNNVEGIVSHYTDAIGLVKKELGAKPDETQKFSAPKDDDVTAASLIKNATKTD